MPSHATAAAAFALVLLAAPSIPDEQAMSIDGKGGSDDDRIGFSIALEGKQLLSGSPGESLFNGANSGYVNAYRQVGSTWQWVYEGLTTDELEAGDEFGWSVDLSGKYAIVGAPGDDDEGTQAGAAYIFVRGSGGEWAVKDKITDDDSTPDDNFGHAVAIDGKLAIVGAPLNNTNGSDSGRVSFFSRNSDGTWSEDDVDSNYFGSDSTVKLGTSVAIDGKTAVAGGPGNGSGSVVIYRRTSQGDWTYETVIAEPSSNLDEYGASVALSGKYLIVGAPKAQVSAVGIGLAYVYARQSNGSWELEDTLQAPSPAGGDQFGAAVSISGTIAVVGAPRDNNGNGVNAGCYYVFKRTRTGSWDLVAGPVIPDDGLAEAEFGAAVAIDKKNVGIGAPQHSDATGRTYLFR